MVVVQSNSGANANRRIMNQKRAEAMASKKKQRESELRTQIDKWFKKFDTDGSATLETEELRALLTHLNPSMPPDDTMLSYLMEKSTDSQNGSITKEATMRTVQKFNTYLKDREQLDGLFLKFDKDQSGQLEQSELLPVLQAFAPSVAPTEDDVIFVLEHCDLDGNHTIDRDELLPMLAEWKEIALDKELIELQMRDMAAEKIAAQEAAYTLMGADGKSRKMSRLQAMEETKRKMKEGKVAPDDGAGQEVPPHERPFSPAKRPPAKKESLRRRVFITFDDPSYSTSAKVISIVMMVVIVISTLAFIAESETLETGALYPVRDTSKTVFEWIEFVCVILFTADYTIRLLTCPHVLKFVFNTLNLVDLAAVLPFWVMYDMEGGTSFGFVRVIRLIRVFRVFKLGRYSVGLQMFAGAMAGSMQPLGILVFVMSINMIIVSSIIHLFEVNQDDPPYPEFCFCTISNTFWWAVVTMTTVGYGDCYPISAGGKVVAILTMLSGVLILALPITVIGSNFAKMVEMFEEDTASYELTDGDGDGMVDELELREFIVRKKKEGVLLKGAETRVSALMEKYDPQGNGTLSQAEFTQLQRDIINPAAGDPMAEIHDIVVKVSANAEAIRTVRAAVEGRIERIERQLAALGGALGVAPPAFGAAAAPADDGGGGVGAADGAAADGAGLPPPPLPPAAPYGGAPLVPHPPTAGRTLPAPRQALDKLPGCNGN